jgi:membrane-associated protease RseP (regulator of RpoE activity)
VLLIHELGHFSMMKLFGYQHVRMLFIPLMGAFVQGKKDVYSQKHSLLVIVMGPFPGILIGYALFYFSGVIKSEWLFDLSVLFMFINMLNLLPLDPLDGGQLFKLLVNNAEELFLLIFSFISSLLLILIGFLLDDFFIMGFGFLMAFRVRGLQKHYHLRKRFREEQIKYTGVYEKLSNKDFHSIKAILLEEEPRLRELNEASDDGVIDQFMAREVDGVLKDEVVLDAGLFFKIVIVLFWLLLFFSPIFIYLFGGNWLNEHYGWYFENV